MRKVDKETNMHIQQNNYKEDVLKSGQRKERYLQRTI
jgi:hypothetical protein